MNPTNPTLTLILEILQIAASIAPAAAVGDSDVAQVTAAAQLAQALLAIAQKASAAYQAQAGKPIDVSLLHAIDPNGQGNMKK